MRRHTAILPILLIIYCSSPLEALNYKCHNNQVLVVQSFGNDTIRMHCQRLDLCGYQKLKCDYDELQPQCGGKLNFVAHVNQKGSTAPVEHTCCNLFNPRSHHSIPTHTGNDCFIYELPDGSSNGKKVDPAPADDAPYAVLKNPAEIPEQFDGVTGYRLRLFLLKNKSPPTLLVKGIERRLDGYRVTICRPRCTSYDKVVSENERTEEGEWKAISWSSWSSSSWSTWARHAFNKAAAESGSDRIRTRMPIGGKTGGADNNINIRVEANGNNNNSFGEKSSTEKYESTLNKGFEPNGKSGERARGESGTETGALAGAGAESKAQAGTDGHGNINISIHTNGDGRSGGNAVAVAGVNVTLNGKDVGTGGGSVNASSFASSGNAEGSGNGKTSPGRDEVGKIKEGSADNKVENSSNKNELKENKNSGKEGDNGSSGPAKKEGEWEDGDGGDEEDENNEGKKGKDPNNGNDENGDNKTSGNGTISVNIHSPDDNNLLGKDDFKNESSNSNKNSGDGNVTADKTEVRTDQDGSRKLSGAKGGDDSDETKKISNGGESETSIIKNRGSGGKGDGIREADGEKKSDKGSENTSGRGTSGEKAGSKSGTNSTKDSEKAPGNQSAKDGNKVKGNGIGKENNNPNGNKASREDGPKEKIDKNQLKESERKKDKGAENGHASETELGGETGSTIGTDGKGSGKEAVGEGSRNEKETNSSGIGSENANGSVRGDKNSGINAPNSVSPVNKKEERQKVSKDGDTLNGGEPNTGKIGADGGRSDTDEGDGVDVTDVEVGTKTLTTPKLEEILARIPDETPNPDPSPEGPSSISEAEVEEHQLTGRQNAQSATGTNTATSNTDSGTTNTGSTSDTTNGEASGTNSGTDSSSGTSQVASDAVQSDASASSGGSGGGRSNCFSADSLVTTVTGQKRMDQLQVGDFVLVPSAGNVLKYERVEMFYHREPETRTNFVVLYTKNGKKISLTGRHLLPVSECSIVEEYIMNPDGIDAAMRESKYAEKAKKGECVLSVDLETREVIADEIVRVGRMTNQGIYSPMTVEGSLIVDGVLSSCFSHLESHSAHKLIFDLVYYVYTAFGLLNTHHVDLQPIPAFVSFAQYLSKTVLPFS